MAVLKPILYQRDDYIQAWDIGAWGEIDARRQHEQAKEEMLKQKILQGHTNNPQSAREEYERVFDTKTPTLKDKRVLLCA